MSNQPTTSAPIIGSTEIRPADHATKPFRIILRFLGAEHGSTPYVVHMETDPGTPKAAFHNGNYCGTMQEAYKRLVERAEHHGLRVLDANLKRIPLARLHDGID